MMLTIDDSEDDRQRKRKRAQHKRPRQTESVWVHLVSTVAAWMGASREETGDVRGYVPKLVARIAITGRSAYWPEVSGTEILYQEPLHGVSQSVEEDKKGIFGVVMYLCRNSYFSTRSRNIGRQNNEKSKGNSSYGTLDIR
eukprot:1658266-Rhodomonas_salina.1